MTTKPEPDELLKEVLAETAPDGFRAASLERTLACARHQRRLRRAMRVGVMAGLVLFAVALWRAQVDSVDTLARNSSQQPALEQAASRTVPGTDIWLVSDEELLAMFPDRPVALVGPPERQRLVFLDVQRGAKTSPGASAGHGLKL